MGPLQSAGGVYREAKRSSKRGRNSNSKTQKCARRDAQYGFLNFRFESARPYHPETANARNVERNFNRSLKYLAKLYDFKPAYFRDLQFPLNVSASYRDAQEKLQGKDSSLSLLITTKNKKVCLATAQTYDTGMFLYYIPVGPVYRLLQINDDKAVAELLLSVFAYLYQIVKIPHFREGYSYLADMYQTMCDMMQNEWEDGQEELLSFEKQLEDSQTFGSVMLQTMKDNKHLGLFKSRLNEFNAASQNQQEIFEMASSMFKLYEDFPEKTIYANLQRKEDCQDAFDEDTFIQLDQYCSFVYDVTGTLFETLEDYVISGLEGYSAKQEPEAFQFFDEQQNKSTHFHQFESRLFPLLGELSRCLIHLL